MRLQRSLTNLSYALASASGVVGFYPGIFSREIEAEPSDFRWSNIEPSKSLVYHPCYNGFQCARLDVPMDWNSTDTDSERVAVAIVKLPAKVPVTDSRYGGPILLNPGGPGGSGVSLMLRGAKPIQRVVDAAYEDDGDHYVVPKGSARYFDMISFDPRGVSYTTPYHYCFLDVNDISEWNTWNKAVIGTEEAPFNTMWARQLAKNMNCPYDAHHSPNGSKIAHFAGTPSVVRDMVEIIERHGEWREAEAAKGHAGLFDQTSMLNSGVFDSTGFRRREETLKWAVGEEPLNYWGFSYGTVLGSTFVTMQPHRAHRVVLDGVDDVDDYYSGEWLSNLVDNEKVMDNFFTSCSASGPEDCAMHTGSSSEDIRKRWYDIVDRIEEHGPIPVASNGTRGPDVITLSDIKKLTAQSLYQPISMFPRLANVMAPLSKDDGSAFADMKHSLRPIPAQDPTCDTVDPYRPECYFGDDYGSDMASAILCADGGSYSTANETRSTFKRYWADLKNQSSWAGDVWAQIRMSCVGYNVRPKFRIPHPVGSNATRENATLFVTNTHDNVTPIRSAKKMAARFAGSGLLHVDIDGHTSLTTPSLCAGKAIRRYFQTGHLPAEGAELCLPQVRPFLGRKAHNLEPEPPERGLRKADAELLDAQWEISSAVMGRKKPRKSS